MQLPSMGSASVRSRAHELAGQPGETPYGAFVRNLTFEAGEEHLKEAFEKYGAVTKTAIARDARGLSRG